MLRHNPTFSLSRSRRAPVLPLDIFPDALLAHSLRALSRTWERELCRVRAYDGGSDQGEADVLPDSDGWASLQSILTNLDATAEGNGLIEGTSTLADLVDAGGSNYDAYVPKVYNQGTARGCEFYQATSSKQPRIVSGGVVQTAGSEAIACLYFDGSNDILECKGFSFNPNESTLFSVQSYLSADSDLIIGAGIGANRWYHAHSVPADSRYSMTSTNYDSSGIGSGASISANNRPSGQLSILNAFRSGGNQAIAADNLSLTTGTYLLQPDVGRRLTSFTVGGSEPFSWTRMHFVEALVFDRSLQSERDLMLAAINRDLGLY